MKTDLSGAFSRGFWNGFCSPMLLFDASGFETESRVPTKYLSTDWNRVIDAILGRRAPGTPGDSSLPSVVKHPSRRWIDHLPSSQAIDDLERVSQSSADRLMKLIAQEQLDRAERHRQAAELNRLNAEFAIRQAERGHWMGFALVIVSVAAGVTTAFMQCPWQVSVAFVSVPLLGAVRAFVPRGKSAS